MKNDKFQPEIWAREIVTLIANDAAISKAPKAFEDVVLNYGNTVTVKDSEDKEVKLELERVYSGNFEISDQDCVLSMNQLRLKYMEPWAEELAAMIRRDLILAQANAPEGMSPTIVSRPVPIPTDASPGSRWMSVSYGGLAMTMVMWYNGMTQSLNAKLEILAEIVCLKSASPKRLVEVAEVRKAIIESIEAERAYQDTRWGTEFDDKNTANDWSKYICDYASGAAPLKLDVANFEEKMLKVAALAIAAVETSRRNGGPAKRHYD